jgi:hypothetical protein
LLRDRLDGAIWQRLLQKMSQTITAPVGETYAICLEGTRYSEDERNIREQESGNYKEKCQREQVNHDLESEVYSGHVSAVVGYPLSIGAPRRGHEELKTFLAITLLFASSVVKSAFHVWSQI